MHPLKRLARPLSLAVAAAGLAALALAAPKPPPDPVPAPAWTLKDVMGKPVSSERYRGKVVVLDFWATWCPPCKEEIPGYVRLQKKYGAEGVVFVGVSVDTAGTEVVKKFMADYAVNYPIVMADEAVQEAYGPLQGYPTTFIIDREGKIRARKLGKEPTEKFEKELLAVLRPPAGT